MSERFQGRGIVKGNRQGAVLVSRTPISFLGDLDIRTGQVIGAASDLQGRSIAGRILVVPSTRGSAGAWRFIYQLKQHDTHPLAIITDDLPDPSVVQGAILSGIPIIAGAAGSISDVVNDNTLVEVDGGTGTVSIIANED
ncbi:MAG: aconitase X swivel domain-containing protein [Methyloligellaceae bacterium]